MGVIDDTPWEQIVEQSGLTLLEIEQAARMYAKGKSVIMCWAMGITQHRHSVPTIQEIANLMLLRGNIGRPGAGLCPVRGHSNVQGDRTMGINERPPVAFLDSLERRFQFKVPREKRPQRGRGDSRHGRRPLKKSSSAWAATSPKPPRTAHGPSRP